MNLIPATGISDDWLYLKLYLGHAANKMDIFIVESMPRLINLQGYDRWFYIRYLDEAGAHIRLRFRHSGESTPDKAGFATTVRLICEKGLLALAQFPPSDYRPMVIPPGFDYGIVPKGIVEIVEDAYEPEYDKFGGVQAMPVAEEAFEVSSEIALRVLNDESLGRYSRKTIAPCFMKTALNMINPLGGADLFWLEYSYYWLGGRTSMAEDLREKYKTKYNQLKIENIPVITPVSELPVQARNLLEQWSDQLRVTSRAYSEIEGGLKITESSLAFQLIHLMNNRIGISGFEEAYLATLLGISTCEEDI